MIRQISILTSYPGDASNIQFAKVYLEACTERENSSAEKVLWIKLTIMGDKLGGTELFWEDAVVIAFYFIMILGVGIWV